ncbi:AarF/UbiB family protein, partial [Acinetobacter baumannii]|uniref:AarF/UbiB family protein n=1 Tax=Acinetobacter baumannii TaxID=470 RepID=UPI0010E3D761
DGYKGQFQGGLDQTPTLPFSYIQGVLASEFEERDLSQIFNYIEDTPLSSASILQIHAAKLITGEDVIIKVQK